MVDVYEGIYEIISPLNFNQIWNITDKIYVFGCVLQRSNYKDDVMPTFWAGLNVWSHE